MLTPKNPPPKTPPRRQIPTDHPDDLGSLDASTQKLTDMVATLSKALIDQGELQTRTLALTKKTDTLEQSQRTGVEKLEQLAVETLTKKSARKRFLASAFVVIVFALGLVYQVHRNASDAHATKVAQMHELDSDYARVLAARDSCVTRNQATQVQITLWKQEYQAMIGYHLTVLAGDLQTAISSTPPIINCSIYIKQAQVLYNEGARM
jgi:hypothetical protein